MNYAKHPNNSDFQKIMLEKSRKFIKDTISLNFRQMQNVSTVVS